MRWLTNIYDPRRPDFKANIHLTTLQTPEDAARDAREWLRDKTVGTPKATRYFTVAELEAMGMVGIYAPEEVES
jgi:hypothetical protein